jgi:hypothetical protein
VKRSIHLFLQTIVGLLPEFAPSDVGDELLDSAAWIVGAKCGIRALLCLLEVVPG